MKKTLIFGGSFNPVHIGHLYIAAEVSEQFGYEQVLFIPVYIAAHKGADRNSPEHRLNMIRSAIDGTDFIVDDCEIRRCGVSYSISTAKEIISRGIVSGNRVLLLAMTCFPDFTGGKRQRHWQKQ